MTKSEFQAFAVSGAFDAVVVRRSPESVMWEVWAHVSGFRGEERFQTARGVRKTWADLMTAYREIRAMGYGGSIVIEG